VCVGRHALPKFGQQLPVLLINDQACRLERPECVCVCVCLCVCVGGGFGALADTKS